MLAGRPFALALSKYGEYWTNLDGSACEVPDASYNSLESLQPGLLAR